VTNPTAAATPVRLTKPSPVMWMNAFTASLASSIATGSFT